MTDYVSRADSFTVACPRCHAEPGAPCIGARDQARAATHRERYQKFSAAGRETRFYDLDQTWLPPDHLRAPHREPDRLTDLERQTGLAHCHEIREQLSRARTRHRKGPDMKALAVAVILAAFVIVTANSADATPTTRPTSVCAQWHATARAAGFSEKQWPTVARIMWRESRCRPGAHNRSGAHGLMQIMPMWRRHCGNIAAPAANLRCARRILAVQGWQAWR